jgi:hypothetical protein
MTKTVSRGFQFVRSNRAYFAGGVISALLLVMLLQFPEWRDRVWSVAFLDIMVIVTAVGTIVIMLLGNPGESGVGNAVHRRMTPERVTAIAAALAIFVTYASFRNQSRLTAETALNTEGQMLFDMEMANANLRCIYTNFAHDDPAACLAKIVRDPEQWSAVSFYIEGVFWLLEKAEEDERAWGSVYSKEIDYWRSYVNEDPTGLFSYYLVSFHESGQAAREAMRRAAVDIPHFCQKYFVVRRALKQANARPSAAVPCT